MGGGEVGGGLERKQWPEDPSREKERWGGGCLGVEVVRSQKSWSGRIEK